MSPEAREEVQALITKARELMAGEAGKVLPLVKTAAEGGWKNNPEWERLSDIWWRMDFVGELLKMALSELENVKPVAPVRMRERRPKPEPAAVQAIPAAPPIRTRVRERVAVREAAE